MNKLLTLIFCAVLPVPALAQPETSLYRAICEDADKVFTSLREGFGEVPLVAGLAAPESGSGTMTVTVNPLTKTWTIVVVRGPKACVIGGGLDFTIRPIDAKLR